MLDRDKNEKISDDAAQSFEMEADEEIKLSPAPELPLPVYGIVDEIAYWGFSQRGESHIKNDELPCQDRCLIEVIEERHLIIAAIADGVGSCMLAHYGAATATSSAVEYLKTKLLADKTELEDSIARELLDAAMKHAYEEVNQEAAEMEQLVYSFQSTLTVALYDGSTLYFAHAGDDGIVILKDGVAKLATVRKKGEEANSVVPLQGLDWEIGKAENVDSVILATDGVLDCFVGGEKENNRIYYPFIEVAVQPDQLLEGKVKEVAEAYYNYMAGPEYRQRVTDDITLVVMSNQKNIKKENLPEFDQEEWDQYTAQREAQIRAALYPEKKVSKESDTKPTLKNKKSSTESALENEKMNTNSRLEDTESDQKIPANYSEKRSISHGSSASYCRSCGRKIPLKDANFCPWCGEPLRYVQPHSRLQQKKKPPEDCKNQKNETYQKIGGLALIVFAVVLVLVVILILFL